MLLNVGGIFSETQTFAWEDDDKIDTIYKSKGQQMVSLAYYQGWKQMFWLCPKVPEITHKHIQISSVNIWYISFVYYISSHFQGYKVNVLPF